MKTKFLLSLTLFLSVILLTSMNSEKKELKKEVKKEIVMSDQHKLANYYIAEFVKAKFTVEFRTAEKIVTRPPGSADCDPTQSNCGGSYFTIVGTPPNTQTYQCAQCWTEPSGMLQTCCKLIQELE